MGDEPLFNNDPTEASGAAPIDSDTTASTQNATVTVEGEALTIDTQTTAAELKDMAGAQDEEVLTFRDGDQLTAINDDKRVLEYADPGTQFEFQPVTGEDGAVFG